jgi:rhamnose transport system permease protein
VKHIPCREAAVFGVFAVILAVLLACAPDFFGTNQLRSLAVGMAPVLLAGIGMTLVIITRQIDISIGYQFAIGGIIAGLLARSGVALPLIVLGTLLTGAALGMVNAVLVVGLELPSIVVTLATLVIYREGLRWFRSGAKVNDLPSSFQWFGCGIDAGSGVIVGVALVTFLAFLFGLRYLSIGRAVYATGSDAEAARLAGLRPARIVSGVFILMGVLTALAALLATVRFSSVDPNEGMGLEMQVIAAVVVGGTAISGGRGNLIGTLVGVLLLGIISSALLFLNLEPAWARAIQGGIILLAVSTDTFAARRHRRV